MFANLRNGRKRPCSNDDEMNDCVFKKECHVNSVTDEIANVYAEHKQTKTQCAQRRQLCECLQDIFKQIFPKCSLHLVGSSSNGFGSSCADADMCLMLTDDNVCQRTESVRLLRLFQKAFRKLSFVRFPFVIKAKVPILRFVDNVSGISVDLNLNNAAGINNTRLLRAYSEKDWRIRPLGLVIKLWAKSNDINDASQQTLSSYALIMMIIHFLQCICTPAVLPVLNPENCATWFDKWKSDNEETLGVLLVKFLRYYSEQFDFNKSIISVRLGKTMVRTPHRYPRSQGNLFCIEEPFEHTNVARCVYNDEKFSKIKSVFHNSLKTIVRKRSLQTILPLK